jgi:hypothetical protein
MADRLPDLLDGRDGLLRRGLHPTNLHPDFFRLRGLRRECLHLRCNNREALTGFARARRFNGCV